MLDMLLAGSAVKAFDKLEELCQELEKGHWLQKIFSKNQKNPYSYMGPNIINTVFRDLHADW
jgi:hypothetical protein